MPRSPDGSSSPQAKNQGDHWNPLSQCLWALIGLILILSARKQNHRIGFGGRNRGSGIRESEEDDATCGAPQMNSMLAESRPKVGIGNAFGGQLFRLCPGFKPRPGC